MQSYCLWFTKPSTICKREINRIWAQLNISFVRCKRQQHFFMQGNLTRIINRYFILVIKTVKWTLGKISSVGYGFVFTWNYFIVCSHGNLMSVYVNVALHEWNRLSKDIKTSSNHINIKNFVISNDTEYSFVKVASLFWTKVHNDSCWWVWLHCSNILAEVKSITRISAQLKLCWEVTVIDYIQNSICLSFDLNFSEVQTLRA